MTDKQRCAAALVNYYSQDRHNVVGTSLLQSDLNNRCDLQFACFVQFRSFEIVTVNAG